MATSRATSCGFWNKGHGGKVDRRTGGQVDRWKGEKAATWDAEPRARLLQLFVGPAGCL
jgi:hypothetical protein